MTINSCRFGHRPQIEAGSTLDDPRIDVGRKIALGSTRERPSARSTPDPPWIRPRWTPDRPWTDAGSTPDQPGMASDRPRIDPRPGPTPAPDRPRIESRWTPDRPGIDLGSTRKIDPRPRIAPWIETPDEPRIDAGSTPCRPHVDLTSTSHRPQIDQSHGVWAALTPLAPVISWAQALGVAVTSVAPATPCRRTRMRRQSVCPIGQKP